MLKMKSAKGSELAVKEMTPRGSAGREGAVAAAVRKEDKVLEDDTGMDRMMAAFGLMTVVLMVEVVVVVVVVVVVAVVVLVVVVVVVNVVVVTNVEEAFT